MLVEIRRGRPEDAKAAAKLIHSAAEEVITDLFGDGCKTKANKFLVHAWHHGRGQYGYEFHWVAQYQSEVVGVITAWHTNLGHAFDRATLDSITAFFDIDESLDVLVKNQLISAELIPPQEHEWMLGHIAVAPAHRDKGIGRMLVSTMYQMAKQFDKSLVVLDVHVQNVPAIRFYQRLGFKEQQVNGQFIRFSKAVTSAM